MFRIRRDKTIAHSFALCRCSRTYFKVVYRTRLSSPSEVDAFAIKIQCFSSSGAGDVGEGNSDGF